MATEEEKVNMRDLIEALREVQTEWGLVAITAVVEVEHGEHLRLTISGATNPVMALFDEHDNVVTFNPERLG